MNDPPTTPPNPPPPTPAQTIAAWADVAREMAGKSAEDADHWSSIAVLLEMAACGLDDLADDDFLKRVDLAVARMAVSQAEVYTQLREDDLCESRDHDGGDDR